MRKMIGNEWLTTAQAGEATAGIAAICVDGGDRGVFSPCNGFYCVYIEYMWDNVVRRIDSNLLCMAACTFLISICGALAEALFSDWAAAWKDCAFGIVVLAAFVIAQGIYGATSPPGIETSNMPEPYSEKLSRKEAFRAQVLTIANPLAEPHDFMSMPLYETERIISSGRYRVELIRSVNGEPTLVLCED